MKNSIKKLIKGQNNCAKRKKRAQLQVEALEDRRLLSTMVGDSPSTSAKPPEALVRKLQQGFSEQTRDEFQDPQKFDALMRTVYGDGYDKALAEQFRQMTLRGDYGFMPGVELISQDMLNGNNAAYNSQDGVIYLAQENLGNVAVLQQAYVEEMGHHLDARLNKVDTAGDEGALFRRLVSGEKVSESQMAALRAENDHGVVVVNGQQVHVEYWGFIKKIGRGIKKVAKGTVKRAKSLGRNIWETGKQLTSSVFRGSLNIIKSIGNGFGGAVKNLFKGNFKAAGKSFLKPFGTAIGTAVEIGAIALHAADSIVHDLISPARGLTEYEKTFLKSVYGDSVDLGKIRIYEKSVAALVDPTAHVVGNNIYTKNFKYKSNGEMTDDSLLLLAHEVAHVWQSQNFGNDYIHRSLGSQILRGKAKTYTYIPDFLAGKDFRNMNPEQQAEFIEDIAQALMSNTALTFNNLATNRTAFRTAIQNAMGGVVLTNDQFNEVINIWSYVRSGGTFYSPGIGAATVPITTAASVAKSTPTVASSKLAPTYKTASKVKVTAPKSTSPTSYARKKVSSPTYVKKLASLPTKLRTFATKYTSSIRRLFTQRFR